jgi:TrkA domain protein
MDVERTALPGIGLQHVFTTGRGRRIGVVSHRSGRRDIVVYQREDPDSAAETVTLTPEEAIVLAELLESSRVVERLAELERHAGVLVTEQIPIEPGSPYDGHMLKDTQARTRTGASIVAVARGSEVFASPRPDFWFRAGDVVVVVGTDEGTAAVAAIFARG